MEKAKELTAIFDEAFSQMTQDEAVGALRAIDVAVEKAWRSEEILTDSQALDNGFLFDWTLTGEKNAGKTIKMPVSPVSFDGKLCSWEYKRGPYPGEHSVEILQKAGFSDVAIRSFIDKGVVAANDVHIGQEGLVKGVGRAEHDYC